MSLISTRFNKGQLCNVILTLNKLFYYQSRLGLDDNHVIINGDNYCDGGIKPELFNKTNVGPGFIFNRMRLFKNIEHMLLHEDEYQKTVSNGRFVDANTFEEAARAIKEGDNVMLDQMMEYPPKDDLSVFKNRFFVKDLYLESQSWIKSIGANPWQTVGVHVRRTDFALFYGGKFLESSEAIKKKLDSIQTEKTAIVFSDDIEWCKKNLKRDAGKLMFSENAEDIDDLMRLAACSSVIRTRGSSFSEVSAIMHKCAVEEGL